jgi:hypothetical protein
MGELVVLHGWMVNFVACLKCVKKRSPKATANQSKDQILTPSVYEQTAPSIHAEDK